MPEPSSALYDFAIATFADSLGRLPEVVASLNDRFTSPPPIVELYGRTESGAVVVFVRLAFAHYSAATRVKMEREAATLKGRLHELALLSSTDRALFYKERLGDLKEVVGADPKAAIASLRSRMGLSRVNRSIALQFATAEDLAATLARSVAEGHLKVPKVKDLAAGAPITLAFQAADLEPVIVKAKVLQAAADGVRVALETNDDLQAFVARHAAQKKEGRRRMPEGGRREHARFDACLDVAFDTGETLRDEYAKNIGKGGLFVRSEAPPPLRAHVRLRLKLPDGRVAETNAEVVHVVTTEEAKVRRAPPGAGLAFATGDTLFQRAISTYLDEHKARRPRLLMAEPDPLMRQVLREALGKAGFELDEAAEGNAALAKISARLYELDALLLNLALPGMDGYCLIDRVRQLGPELDLKILVFVPDAADPSIPSLVGPGGADEAIAQGTPTEEIVARIQRALGR